jgi:hypothetical protein
MKHILIRLTTSSVSPLQLLFAYPNPGPPPPHTKMSDPIPLTSLVFIPLDDHCRTHLDFYILKIFLALHFYFPCVYSFRWPLPYTHRLFISKRFFLALHMALSHIHTFIVYAQSVIFPNPSPDFIPQKYYHYRTHLISETFFLKLFLSLLMALPHIHTFIVYVQQLYSLILTLIHATT